MTTYLVQRLTYAVIAIALIAGNALAQNSWRSAGLSGSVRDITTSGTNIYALTDKAAFVSSDESHWQKIFTLPTSQDYYSIVVLSSGELFIFGYDSYYMSSNAGATWSKVEQTGFSTRRVIADHSDYLYSGQNDPIKVSTDKAQHWTDSKQGTTQEFFDIGVFYLAADGSLYAGNQGITGGLVYRTTNQGASWSLVHSESMDDVTAIMGSKDGIRIAYGDKLLGSSNGSQWETLMTYSFTNLITALFSPGEDELYAGQRSVGVIYSSDLGYSWSAAMPGIKGTNVEKFVRSPSGNVLVGTDSGLFSNATLASATETNSANTEKLNVSLDRTGRILTASYDGPLALGVKLEVLDALGRTVRETEMHASTSTINVQDLTAGAYFVRYSIGGVTRIERFAIVRML